MIRIGDVSIYLYISGFFCVVVVFFQLSTTPVKERTERKLTVQYLLCASAVQCFLVYIVHEIGIVVSILLMGKLMLRFDMPKVKWYQGKY